VCNDCSKIATCEALVQEVYNVPAARLIPATRVATETISFHFCSQLHRARRNLKFARFEIETGKDPERSSKDPKRVILFWRREPSTMNLKFEIDVIANSKP
jgi:hypothetical protein